MSKPMLKYPFVTLEADLIETFLGGHRESRPDLQFPESYSDCQSGMRTLMRTFEIRRRAVPLDRAELLSEAKHGE